MSALREKQALFTRLLVRLLRYADEHGYQPILDEVYRPPETAELYARQGRGTRTAHSLHCSKLAADLDCFAIDGRFLADSTSYRPLGEYWKSLDPLCRWGGDFHVPDGRHFSLEHEGRK